MGDTHNIFVYGDNIKTQINIYGDKEAASKLAKADGGLSLRQRLDIVTKMMRHGRHWFPICKGMMQRGIVERGDFVGAANMITEAYGEMGLPYNINPEDIAKLNVLSFSKDIEDWDKDNSPIEGNKFFHYKAIGIAFLGTYEE